MKLDVDVNEVVLSNVGTTGEFRIRNSAKAFKILSDGLYSNKIRAIIRELSCNAVDSHVAAGKADVPFEVHLPTILEPWFAVRDFGLGLSGDQVTNIYTTYFESTKTDSNAFIGALGLGSKSPFSYTENFTITAIKDGYKRIYSAFINEVGVPCVAEMSQELTDEGNGVEVKFSVTDKYDYQSFRHESHQVFMWFKNKPTIVGVDHFEHGVPEYREKDIVKGVHVRDHGGSYAVMGNIAYPLGKIPEPSKHFGSLASLLECNLVIEFEIGDLDFAASREELSYVPLTLKSIKRRLEELNANLAVHIAQKADAITNEWDRADFLYQQNQSRLFKSAVVKYATDTKFPLFDPNAYHGKKTFSFLASDFTARGLGVVAFRAMHGGTSRVDTISRNYRGNNYVEEIQFPVESDVVFVLNDLKTGCAARAKYHFANFNNNKRVTVFCISHNDADVANRQVEYDKLMKELHNPPVIVKASTLQKQEKKKPLSTQGIMTLKLKADRRRGYEDSYVWSPYHEEIDENVTYYYVSLSNYQALTQDGEHPLNVQQIKAWMDECGIPDISNIQVFGVRKNRIKELQELDNWVWLEDKLKAEIAKVSDSKVVSLVAAELLDNYNNRVYTNATVAKAVGPDSPYAKYMSEYGNVKKTNGNVSQLVALCANYGKSVQVDKIKLQIEAAKSALFARYPLMKYMLHATEKEAADYIKLVDKTENMK